MNNFSAEARDLFEFTRALRRDFHRHPELAFQEVRTAGIVADELSELGFELKTGVGQTGVTGLLRGNAPGKVVLVRFDMDALPIQEETGAEYASEHPGIMHACGHDGHVAVGLTVARMLHAHQKELQGSVKLVFQPAEEGASGALRMIQDGVLENPVPDFALALHLWNDKPAGWLGIVPGPIMAGADFFTVQIDGKGGHGAMPQESIDPVYAAAQIISALQSIVSRNVSPLQSAVISVTRVQAGTASNVIPSTAEFSGTVRTFEPEVHDLVLKRFKELVVGVAAALGCTAKIQFNDPCAAVINDSAITDLVHQAALKTWPEAAIDSNYRAMVSEDMSEILRLVPGCYFMVGSANVERGLVYGHHNSRFDFDETVLPEAAAIMTAAVFQILNR
ncbi:MAG: amidohydrolase [Anaerolineaceae bacterium]|nr:amidohydrolase [Anaerolineaceae bacterium]